MYLCENIHLVYFHKSKVVIQSSKLISANNHNDLELLIRTGTGAADNDESLAAFARASAPRTERLRQRYGQDSHPVSSDDEHDDYGELSRSSLGVLLYKIKCIK